MTATPGGSRRDKRFCGATKRQGEGTCRRPAGWGTDHPGYGNCKLHAGTTPNGRIKAQRLMATEALVALGAPIDVDPLEALIHQLHEAYGHAAYLRCELEDAEALYGPDHLGDARPHVLWAMWSQERDRATKIAAECHKAGISEREVQVAEMQAQIFASALRSILDDPELALSAGQLAAAPDVVRRHLTAIPVRSTAVAS